jgi:hypothetical protein
MLSLPPEMTGVMTQNIDLSKVAGGGTVHNLTGKDRGIAARRALELDWLDRQADRVAIHVPSFLLAITDSFLFGLFSESIQRLGLDGFYAKYSFVAGPAMLHQIRRGLERAAAPRPRLLTDAA